jgi:hypothetical protein
MFTASVNSALIERAGARFKGGIPWPIYALPCAAQ